MIPEIIASAVFGFLIGLTVYKLGVLIDNKKIKNNTVNNILKQDKTFYIDGKEYSFRKIIEEEQKKQQQTRDNVLSQEAYLKNNLPEEFKNSRKFKEEYIKLKQNQLNDHLINYNNDQFNNQKKRSFLRGFINFLNPFHKNTEVTNSQQQYNNQNDQIVKEFIKRNRENIPKPVINPQQGANIDLIKAVIEQLEKNKEKKPTRKKRR